MKTENIDKCIKKEIETKIESLDDQDQVIKFIIQSLKKTEKTFQVKAIAYAKQISLVDNHLDPSEFNIYYKVATGLGIDINSAEVQDAWEKIDLKE